MHKFRFTRTFIWCRHKKELSHHKKTVSSQFINSSPSRSPRCTTLGIMNYPTDWTPSLWRETFAELVDDDGELDYGDLWSLNFNYNLTDKVTSEERRRGWKVHKNHGFGSFQCGHCQKVWSSARVVIVFQYRLRNQKGTVIMRPFGQCCLRCRNTFELPGFSDETVKAALLKVCSKIRKNCYNEDEGETPRSNTFKKWTKPHETALCEACQKGICKQDDE